MTAPRAGRAAAALAWAFRDRRTGGITVAQAPNAPLLLFLVLTALAWAARSVATVARPAAVWLEVGAAAALTWWALLEIVSGVNPWRRFLGVAVLAGYGWLHLWSRTG